VPPLPPFPVPLMLPSPPLAVPPFIAIPPFPPFALFELPVLLEVMPFSFVVSFLAYLYRKYFITIFQQIFMNPFSKIDHDLSAILLLYLTKETVYHLLVVLQILFALYLTYPRFLFPRLDAY
jgi:hypothetical protein